MVTSADAIPAQTRYDNQPPTIPVMRTGREPGRPPTPPSSATRHLSAAAYLDESFCSASLDEVYHQDRRIVAPSLGFNLSTVLNHCLRARKIRLFRDIAIVAALGFALVFLTTGFAIGLTIFLGLYGIHAGWRFLLAAADYTSNEQGRAQKVFSAGFRFIVICIAQFLAVALAYYSAESLTSQIEQAGVVNPDNVSLLFFGAGAIITMFAILAVPALTDLTLWHMATRHAPGHKAVPLASNRRVQQIEQQQLGNTAVFSGFRPFVGSGEHLNTASFALRMVRASRGEDAANEAAREYSQLPFRADQLIRHVKDHLTGLTVSAQPEGRLPNLRVIDRLYVAGNEVNRLGTDSTIDEMVEIIREPIDAKRHYLACEVSSWDGELVTSVYLHFALQGRTLYVETTTYGLAPCYDEYRIIDDVSSVGAVPYFVHAGLAALKSPKTVLSAPRNLVRGVWQLFTRATAGTQQAQSLTLGFDYGARMSIRELGSEGMLRNAFQLQDIDKYWRIIQRRAHAAVLDFLEAHGVDVSELRQRFEQIVNNGVLVKGKAGDVNISGSVGNSGTISGSFNGSSPSSSSSSSSSPSSPAPAPTPAR